MFTALRSGDEADLADVKWWVQEDEENIGGWDDDGVAHAPAGLARLVRCVRHGQISNGLRMIARWLYSN